MKNKKNKAILGLTLAILLSGCFGNNNSDNSSDGGGAGAAVNQSLREVAPATLDDEGKALMHAMLAISISGPAASNAASSTANSRQTQASRVLSDSRIIANQETTACNGGGQIVDLGTEQRNVDSPYTESLYNVSMEDDQNCVVEIGDTYALTDGYFESGFPVGDTDFNPLYQLMGRDIDEPYHWRLGTPPGSETPDYFDWLGVWLQHVQHDTDGTDGGSSYQYLVLLGKTVDADGTFRGLTQFGTSPAKEDMFYHSVGEVTGFSIDERYIATVDGVFGAETFEPQIPNECQFGRLHFETLEQVLVEVVPVVDGTEYRFIDGQLLLTDETGNTAEIEYDNDSMMVSLNDGPQQTFTREQLRARQTACEDGT